MKLAMTGGHHSSALPVIQKLKETHPDIEIVWYGHRTSQKGDTNDTLEYREITALGIPFINLQAGKVYRINSFRALFKIPNGFSQAFVSLLNEKPAAILSFGGYLAAPVVFCGWLLGIPSITHEQTTVAGYANRFISFFAKKILVSWESSMKFFPKNKVVYTGLPLRREIFEVRTDNFHPAPNLPTVCVTTGKSGSIMINNMIREILPELLNVCNVIHQTGDHSLYRDYDSLSSQYGILTPKPQGRYFLRKFILGDEIGEAYKKSDMILSRCGAHICSEILALKKPALMIPIPWVSHNEQMQNALMVKDAGLGEILEEKAADPEILLKTIKNMLSNLAKYVTTKDFSPREPPENLIVAEVLKILK